MATSYKIWLVIGLVLAVGAAVGAQVITVLTTGYQQAGYTTNAGELTERVLVGQTIQAGQDNLAGISVMFATYSGRENGGIVELHVRESIDSRRDLRVARVAVSQLGDNQFYRFTFEPLENSRGKNYFFYIKADGSSPGRAVTVDLDTRDPYYLGTAFIVKDQDESQVDGEVWARSGKQSIDIAFADHYRLPVRLAAYNKSREFARTFVLTWNERKDGYLLWLKVALPGLLWLVLVVAASRMYQQSSRLYQDRRKLTRRLMWLLLLLAVGMRIAYAVEMPVTNDEGNYLYDARSLLQGKLAGGDGYVKAPLFIAWVSLWRLIGGSSILAGRLSSVVIGALTLIPLYIIGRELGGRKAGLAAAATWALFGVTTVFNVYVHTQSMAIFFAASGIAVLLMALRGGTPRLTISSVAKAPADTSWFLAAGILLGLGVVSRKSVLAVGLVPLALILLEGIDWRHRIKHLLAVGVGFLIVIGIFLTGAGLVYGVEGFWEALGVNSAEDGLSAVEPEQIEQVRAYSLRGMTPFFRESLPLILLSMVGLGLTIERWVRSFLGAVWRKKMASKSMTVLDQVLPKVGWIGPLWVYWWAWGFFTEYEGSSIMVFGMAGLWYAMAVVLVIAALLPRPAREAMKLKVPRRDAENKARKKPIKMPPNVLRRTAVPTMVGRKAKDDKVFGWAVVNRRLSTALLAPLWLGGLVFFYMNWIKFHANYIGEFLPPLVILAGLGAPMIWDRLAVLAQGKFGQYFGRPLRWILAAVTGGVLMWALFVSGFVTLVYEHTGTFQQGAIKEAAVWAKDNIPMDEVIFTGAAVVPYLSGHNIALDIAHPRWYAYEFTRTDTVRLTTFLPAVEEMLNAYREARWFLLDKQTGFSFLMEYSEIEAGLETDWEAVQGIENGSNTLTFYRRK